MAAPTINDQYWFDLSKTLTDGASTARNDAAAKLQTMVAWFWSVYTTAITIGALATKNFPAYVFALLAAPSIILILAYWMTVRAQMPADVRFDPRSPDDIQRAFNAGMGQKKQALSLALLFSFVAAIFLGAALFAVGTVKEIKPLAATPPLVPSFTASQQVTRQPYVRVSGIIPDANTARIVVTPLDPKTEPAVVVLAPVGPKNELLSNVPVKTEMKKYSVSVEWVQSDKGLRSIVKTF